MPGPLVGAIGVFGSGTSNNNFTPTWGPGTNRTAGNLLICWGANIGNGTPCITPSGWTGVHTGVAGSGFWNCIYYKVAAGGDAAPSFIYSGQLGSIYGGQLAEFQAAGTPAVDQYATTTTTATSGTIANPAVDSAPGDLVIVQITSKTSALTAVSGTDVFNNGAITIPNNDYAPNANTYHFSHAWGQTISNSAPTQDTVGGLVQSGGFTFGFTIATFKGVQIANNIMTVA